MTNMPDIAMDTDTPVRAEGSERSNSTPETQQPTTMPNDKPAIIGLYGVPGCGKTYLLTRLKEILDEGKFEFFEGSAVINRLVTGGLDKFRTLDDEGKGMWRKLAIEWIRDKTVKSGKPAIITGHFMFWSEGGEQQPVYTKADLKTYTHILYLDVDPQVVTRRRADDKLRNRSNESVQHLQNGRCMRSRSFANYVKNIRFCSCLCRLV